MIALVSLTEVPGVQWHERGVATSVSEEVVG